MDTAVDAWAHSIGMGMAMETTVGMSVTMGTTVQT